MTPGSLRYGVDEYLWINLRNATILTSSAGVFGGVHSELVVCCVVHAAGFREEARGRPSDNLELSL